MHDVSHVIEQLNQIMEELTDLSMKILSDAIAEGAQSRPLEEKKISQARRSLEKAVSQLSGIG